MSTTVTPGAATRRPHPSLRSYIQTYGGFAGSAAEPASFLRAPTGCVTLIVSLAAQIEVSRTSSAGHDGSAVHQALIGGLRDAPIRVGNSSGAIDTLHIGLSPLGTRTLLGVPSGEFVGQTVDLQEVMGARAGTLLQRLHDSASWAARFDVLDASLREGLHDDAADPLIDWAWRRLTASHGEISIATLARESGYSRRHLGERFKSELGMSPKTVARIARFEHAAALIRHRRGALVEVAAMAGYADQSHMSRDWLALSGRTPSDWMREELPFLQDHEIFGGDDGGLATGGA